MFRLSMSLRVMESDTIVRVYIHHFLLVIQRRAFSEISGEISDENAFFVLHVYLTPPLMVSRRKYVLPIQLRKLE